MTTEKPGEKLERYLKRVGMQQKELAMRVGVEPSYISRLVTDRVNWVTSKYFGQIATALRLNDDEVRELNPAAVVEPPELDPLVVKLLENMERKNLEEVLKDFAPLIIPLSRRNKDILKGTLQEFLANEPETTVDEDSEGRLILRNFTQNPLAQVRDDVSPVTNVYKVPVIGMAAAGYGVDLTEVEPIAYDYVAPENYRQSMIILQVDGNSMEASGEVDSLHPGDWIYVDPRDLNLQDNKIYVVYIPDRGVLVKRVRKWPQGWMLTSDNNEYPPFDADEANVIGRVYYRQPKGERL